MRLKRLTNYLLDNRYKALALTFLVTFIPVFGIFGILFAGLVTLRRGAVEGAAFTLAATLPYLFSFYFTGNHHPELPFFAFIAVGAAVTSNLLTWLFAVMLGRKVSFSMMLQIAALLGVLVVSVVHLAYPEVGDWWVTQLTSYFSQMQDTANQAGSVSPTDEVNIANQYQYATGLIVTAILFNAVLQLIASFWWKAMVYQPGSLRKELHNLRLSKLAGVLFIVSLVLSYLGNTVVLDIMPILYLLFGAAGLSLIHCLFTQINGPVVWFWLTLLYMTLIFAMMVSLITISLLAVVDIWFDLRRKLKRV